MRRDAGQTIPPEAIRGPEQAINQEINAQLVEFGVGYNPEIAESENDRRLRILEQMREYGILETGEKPVFDIDKLDAWKKKNPQAQKRHILHEEIMEALRGVRAFSRAYAQSPEFRNNQGSPADIIHFPKNLDELTTAYPTDSQKALYQPWELSGRVTPWEHQFKLDSGESISMAELFIANKLLFDLKARRTEQGELEIWDKERGEYRKFSAGLFRELSGHSPRVGGMEFYVSPREFIDRVTPNLVRRGVLTPEDTRVTAGSSTAEKYTSHERKLDPGTNNYISLSNQGNALKYYLGRQKITGTEHRITEGNTRLRQLDPSIIGVIEEQHGRKRLLYTLTLCGPEEARGKREEVRKRFLAEGRKLSEAEISARAVVGGEEMKDRIKPYNVTEYVPKRTDETPQQYAKRISDLSDVDFVTKKFQSFFAEAGVGVHTLPWAEQLVLANAILEERDKKRLVDFAKRFGMEGLRSFLSVDYDSRMAGDVLDIGDKLDNAKEVFIAYTKLIDLAKEVGETIHDSDLEKDLALQGRGLDFVRQFSEAVMRRAKDMLVAGAEVGRKGKAGAKAYGQAVEVRNHGEILAALQGYSDALEKVKALLKPEQASGKYTASLDSSYLVQIPRTYNFQLAETGTGRVSHMSLQLREQGTSQPNKQFEYDGEARINLLFSDQPISPFVTDLSRQNALSLRIDREGKTRQAGEIIANDPTRKDGEVSLEIGSFKDVIGRVVSVGNALDAKRRGKESAQYYHNRESFAETFGDAEVFARMVKFIQKQVQEKYAIPESGVRAA